MTGGINRVPKHHQAGATLGSVHYDDRFSTVIIDHADKINVNDVARAFFFASPKWVQSLFAVRNSVVGVFGLKTPGHERNRQDLLVNCKFQPGNKLGLFSVFAHGENEIIIGENDSHLNFRVSLSLENTTENRAQKKLSISTRVEFNNKIGKIYFSVVRPFHRIIVRAMLRNISQRLSEVG